MLIIILLYKWFVNIDTAILLHKCFIYINTTIYKRKQMFFQSTIHFNIVSTEKEYNFIWRKDSRSCRKIAGMWIEGQLNLDDYQQRT